MATPPDFTTGQVLTAAQMNAVGLWKVTPGAVSAAGTINADGSVTFSGATSIEIRNVFNSDYANYKIVITNFMSATTTTRQINFRLMDNTTEANSAQYWTVHNATLPSNNGVFAATASLTFHVMGESSNQGGASGHFTFDVFTPNQTINTSAAYTGYTYQANAGQYVYRFGGFTHQVADDYNGFKILGTTDNIEGVIRVYGYN